jgi:hypothetical protein
MAAAAAGSMAAAAAVGSTVDDKSGCRTLVMLLQLEKL